MSIFNFSVHCDIDFELNSDGWRKGGKGSEDGCRLMGARKKLRNVF
jgi:hypothetical protein